MTTSKNIPKKGKVKIFPNFKKRLTNNQTYAIIIIENEREVNQMKTLDFFCEWTKEAATAVHAVEMAFPCFTMKTPVECGWMEVEILARQEDMPRIEILLAGIV